MSKESTSIQLSALEKDEDALPIPVQATPTTPTAPSTRTKVFIVLNCIATIAVVFLNKVTFSDGQLRNCQITTTIYHFTTTFLLLYLASSPPPALREYYQPLFPGRWLPIKSISPICILFASFLVLGNLSLTFNTVSFYQLAKILTVPTVVLFNFLFFRKTISLQKLCTVGIACLGVAIATGASVRSNLLGTCLAVAAFCCTALYQISIGRMLAAPIDGVEVSAPQLLMNQTLASSVMLLVLVPFFDTRPVFGDIPSPVVATWLVSGLVAAVINLTQFLIIGSTSVLTFNVVGIIKTVLTLVLAWWIEGKVVGLGDLCGVFLAIGGSFAYTQVRG